MSAMSLSELFGDLDEEDDEEDFRPNAAEISDIESAEEMETDMPLPMCPILKVRRVSFFRPESGKFNQKFVFICCNAQRHFASYSHRFNAHLYLTLLRFIPPKIPGQYRK